MRTSSGGGDGVGGGGIHHHPWASGSAPCSASHSIVVEMTSFVINDAMTAVHVRSTTKTKGFNIAIVDECWLAVDNTIKVNRTNNFHFDPGGWLANSVLAGSFMRLFGRSSSLARVAWGSSSFVCYFQLLRSWTHRGVANTVGLLEQKGEMRYNVKRTDM